MNRAAPQLLPVFLASVVPAAGDRVRVAHGVFGRIGWVRSTSPGHVVVHYESGGREIIDLTRRTIWIIE
jgi:hypothetical protein